MKSIQLQESKENIEVNGTTKEIDIKTLELLKICINTPPEGGYNISDLMLRLKMLDLVDKADKKKAKTIEFEDADFSKLSEVVKSTKWNILSKKILEFVQLFN